MRANPNADRQIGSVIVARTKSGWTWLCLACGDGAISGKKASWRDLTLNQAEIHARSCPVASTRDAGPAESSG